MFSLCPSPPQQHFFFRYLILSLASLPPPPPPGNIYSKIYAECKVVFPHYHKIFLAQVTMTFDIGQICLKSNQFISMWYPWTKYDQNPPTGFSNIAFITRSWTDGRADNLTTQCLWHPWGGGGGGA